jgi:hypothetical protein
MAWVDKGRGDSETLVSNGRGAHPITKSSRVCLLRSMRSGMGKYQGLLLDQWQEVQGVVFQAYGVYVSNRCSDYCLCTTGTDNPPE